MSEARAPLPWDSNPLSNYWFIAFCVCLAVGFAFLFINNPDRDTERRIFWAVNLIAAGFAFLIFWPSWTTGLAVAAAFLVGMTITAYFMGSNIKIRGKIYSASPQHIEPETSSSDDHDANYDPHPDSYAGMATATKAWWLMVAMMCICSVNIVYYLMFHKGGIALPIGCAIGVAVLAIGYGHYDASWGYSIARRQYFQFALITLITSGTFTVLYLAGFSIGKRLPYRSRRSLEQVHPRFRHEKSD